MNRNKKTRFLFIVTLIIITIITIPSVYAFYFSKYESSILSKLIISLPGNNIYNSYVRASILTYWVDKNICEDKNDLTTCNISGKSSWSIKTNAINSDWHLLEDGYYYYKTSIDNEELNKDNIKNSSIALINPSLSLNELTNENLSATNIVPQYEILYEFIETIGVEEAWGVTYQNNIPEIIE